MVKSGKRLLGFFGQSSPMFRENRDIRERERSRQCENFRNLTGPALALA